MTMDDHLFLPPPKSPRSDAVENRKLLLKTAQRLFNEQGVETVSMAAIAQAAGVGKGTLYRHFENKSALCMALLDEDQRELQERTLQRLRENHDPLDNLRWFVLQVLAFVENNRRLLCVSSSERPVSMLEHPAHLWWRQTIRQLITRLNPIGDADYMADVLYIMLDSSTNAFQRDSLGYARQRVEDGLLTLILNFVG